MSEPVTIAVVMGGPSPEHDISLQSGRGVTDALISRGFQAQPIVIPKEQTVESARATARKALAAAKADVVFIALHGTFGEDGTIQQVCDELQVAYTGSDAAASRLGIDKTASRERFEQAGLQVPRWRAIPADRPSRRAGRGRNGHAATIAQVLGFPLVVKPVSQGSSVGVCVVINLNELPGALAEAGRYGDTVLLEEFVSGYELTVGVVGDSALPIIGIRPSRRFFDFTAKYTTGATLYEVPAVLDPDTIRTVQEAGRQAHAAIGCRHFSRTDLILTRDHVPVILEINTIPGFTPTSLLPKAAASVGISYDVLCERLIQMAWHEHQLVVVEDQ